ncbi:hypothetical protein N9444_08915 [Gammaproteobacteria bacterium]|nr:hypothetical protein [Gammaproteobacteria bacterium]
MTAFLNPLKLLPINNLFQRKSVPPPKREIFCFCARDNQGPQEQVISIVNTAPANGSGLVMVLLPLPRIMVTALLQMMFMLILVSWVREMLAELAR